MTTIISGGEIYFQNIQGQEGSRSTYVSTISLRRRITPLIVTAAVVLECNKKENVAQVQKLRALH